MRNRHGFLLASVLPCELGSHLCAVLLGGGCVCFLRLRAVATIVHSCKGPGCRGESWRGGSWGARMQAKSLSGPAHFRTHAFATVSEAFSPKRSFSWSVVALPARALSVSGAWLCLNRKLWHLSLPHSNTVCSGISCQAPGGLAFKDPTPFHTGAFP